MLKNYFKTALRNLSRNRIHTIINTLGLSIGLTCCMLILLYNKDEISYDRFHSNKDNIYRVTSTLTHADGNVKKNSSTGMMPGPRFKSNIPEIEDYVRVMSGRFTARHDAAIFEQEALLADSNFFRFFTFPFIAGDPGTALDNAHSVVLSEEVAEKYFGRKDAIGQTIELKIGEGFELFNVSGIVKRSPENSSLKIKMLVPLRLKQDLFNDNKWVNFFLNTFISLKPGSDPKTVESKFARIFGSEAAAQLKEIADKYGFKDKVAFGLQPLLQMHLSTDFPARNGLADASKPMYSYILTCIALFILSIACINFINLTIGHSLKRAKEIGIRKVVGGQRKQLIGQFLGESLMLSLIAFLLAILLTWLVLPFFNTLSNKALSFSYLFDLKLAAYYAGLFLVTGLLAGFYPALVLSKFNPVQTLSGKFALPARNYLSKGLVVFQFTLSTFLIVATVVIYSQSSYLLNFDLGYNDQNVVSVNTGEMDKRTLDVLRNELFKNASIESVTADQGGNQETIAHINDGIKVTFDFKHIDEEYFPLFQIPLVSGRNFSKDFPSDTAAAAIVNEAFARTAGWKDPLGKQVDFFYMNKKYTVVGVIKDYHYASLAEKIEPQLFTISPNYKYRDVFIKIKPGNNSATLAYISQTFKGLFPVQPYQYYFKDAQNTAQYEQEARWKQVFTFGAILTILISCIGLFGLASLSIHHRTKEIGIRKVLGASVTVIVKQLAGSFLRLVILAAVIASPLSWFLMDRWLHNYPYRTEISWWMFGIAGLIALITASLTIGYQAIKASVANPVKSLRA